MKVNVEHIIKRNIIVNISEDRSLSDKNYTNNYYAKEDCSINGPTSVFRDFGRYQKKRIHIQDQDSAFQEHRIP